MNVLEMCDRRPSRLYVTFRLDDRRGMATLGFSVLGGWLGRLRGLLGTRRGGPGACPVALLRCSSVHTAGMRYRIDVALVGEDGRVLRSVRRVPPGKLVRAGAAVLALERPSEAGPWPRAGCVVELDEPRCVQARREDEDGR